MTGVMTTLVLSTALVSAPPAVSVSTSEGEELTGQLVELSPTAAKVKTATETREVPVESILKIGFTETKAATPDATASTVNLVDGSRFRVKTLITKDDKLAVESIYLGKLDIPMSAIKSLQIAAPNTKLNDSWLELLGQENKRDLLVISRKGEVLDHLDGVVGAIDDKFVKFLLDGDLLPVKRERVYGVIYSRTPSKQTPLCQVSLVAEEALQVSTVSLTDEGLVVTSLSGSEVTLPFSSVQSLDFSQQKIEFLSQLDIRDVEYNPPPLFSLPIDRHQIELRKDRVHVQMPLRVGSKEYNKGLWLHSDTTVEYRLGREYQKFTATVGIQKDTADNRVGDVKVTIEADGKALFDERVQWKDDPKVVELDVTNVRDLTIKVVRGRPNSTGVGDHLVLGDAKLIK